MSESNDVTRPSSPASVPPPGAPEVGAAQTLAQNVSTLPAPVPQASAEDDARERIASMEREAKALATTEPQTAALLFHEVGLLWEEPLKNPRNAAVAFQNAYKLAPRFLANIRAARRLFADVGNWQMVVQLIDAELTASEDPRQQASLLFEKGQILEERLSRDNDAADALRQALDRKPTDVTLLTQLESVYAARNDAGALVEIYRLLATAVVPPSLRAHYLTSAGMLLEERLKQKDAAAAAFREAFALDRSDPLLQAAVKRVAEREGRTDELLSALLSEAEGQGSQGAPAYLHIAKVHDRLGRKDDALSALLAARRVSPHEPLVLSALAGIYETQGRFEELADVLLAWVGSINDESELVAINLRLAALYEDDLKRDQEAAARYQAILARIPSHAAALAGLGKLSYRMQNWEGLVAVFDAEVTAAEDAKGKAARMYKAAEILEERLGRQEDAIARYNACLQLQPGYLPAQKALTRLYERQGRFAELVQMFEQDLLQTSDRDQVITTLNKMAVIYEDRLGDLDHAIECMKRILDLASDHLPTLRNLARLYERAGRYRELLETNDLEASFAGDTKQVLSLLHRNAEILDEHLKDRVGAITAYERVLALSPSYLPALKALGRLYAQDGRWEKLIDMYRAESEISPSTDAAAALIYKIGELYEHRLKQENEALASYQEALMLAPSYFPALRALARIHRAHGAWESLVEVLRADAANRTDPLERANAMYQAAAIWEDQLGRPELAIEGYQEVLRLTPGHAATLRALERLYVAQDNVKELVSILDRETQVGQTPAAKVTAYLKLARLYLDRFQEPSRAAQCCESVLGLEPGNLTALMLLERIRVSDRVRRAELRARIAERVTDTRLSSALRILAAADQEKGPPSERTLEVYQRAFDADPSDARLAFGLERVLRQSGDTAALSRMYGMRLAVTTDATEALELLLRAAELAEKNPDQEQAAALYQQALELQAQCLPALQGARRVALRRSDFATARAMMETEARASRDTKSAIEGFVAAAKLAAQKLNDPDGAAALYRLALERDPLHPGAATGLEELLAQRGGSSDLAALHERRAEARLAQRDAEAAAAAYVTAARLHNVALGDRDRALAVLEKALAARPGFPDALETRGLLLLEAQQYAEAAQMLGQRVQQGGDPRVLAQHHLTLGALYQQHLNDPGRAAAHLQTALATLPRHPEALERLATVYAQGRNFGGAVDCLRRLLDQDLPNDARARFTVELARIHEEGLGDVASATALYKKALELTPGEPALVDRLVALYERQRNLPELAQMLEAQAAATASTDVKRAVSLRMRVASFYAGPLTEPARATVIYRQLVEQDPQNLGARAALADLYGRDMTSFPLAIEEHRQILRQDPARVDSLHALFKLWDAQKQQDKAFAVAAVLTFMRATNEVEQAYYSEARARQPQEPREALPAADVDTVLMHPAARGPLTDLLRAMGEHLGKVYPPQFEMLGVNPKQDKLKPDSAVYKAVRAVAQTFGVEEFEVYLARRGMLQPETTEPLSLCVGQDVVRRFNAREQKFLIGKAVLGLLNKTAVLSKLSQGETVDLFGNAIRVHVQQFNGLGRRNDDTTKQLKKAFSRKAMKASEGPAQTLSEQSKIDVATVVDALGFSADRAGLLVCGDPSVGLTMVLREDPNIVANRQDGTTDGILQAVRERADLKALLSWLLTDDFFRLRQRIGLSL
ncbi:adventurous gliding motility protein AgmK [Corallococcus coralloides]|uniref:Adventurous gliding motility protein AgmK n=1 Tax=Corallococcus coralloides TaxID=184914 RepID=A0A410RVW5_CORCK|nr:tetratricopeptide repeat protein [Corallococcus coralloides]QAT85981.1 adventurous gliding motility protein AgmK [Corallococcus coralloides]